VGNPKSDLGDSFVLELHAESGEAYCVCEDGWTYDPKNISAGCTGKN